MIVEKMLGNQSVIISLDIDNFYLTDSIKLQIRIWIW